MIKVDKIWDGTDPGATPGRAFTASIGQEIIVPAGNFLDHLKIGLQGAVATAAVVIETFVGLLSEYSFRVGAETRIKLTARQLIALAAFYYKELPRIWENTDNTGFDFIGGIKVPLQIKVDKDKPLNHSATRTAQTNISVETIGVTGNYLENDGGKKAIHCVAIDKTTAAAAGYDLADLELPPIGTLVGVILQTPGIFADGNIDVSVQRLRLLVDGELHSQFNSLSDCLAIPGVYPGTILPISDLLGVFDFYDLRPEGIDLKTHKVKFQLDVQDVSDAISILPVIELA